MNEHMVKSHQPITAIVNTLNEEDNISDCLKYLKWANEIIVVDMHSDDNTVKIAQNLGARVYSHKRTGYVEPARNFAISKANNDWILVVDADERIPNTLSTLIQESVDSAQADVFYIAEKNIVFGEWVKGNLLWPDYHPRLFRKGYVAWSDRVHDIPKPRGKVKYLPAEEEYAIEHLSRSYLTVGGFLRSYASYSAKEVFVLEDIGYQFRRRHVFILPYREFKMRYFKGKSYQDGFRGLVISLLFTMYKFMVLAQFWEKKQNKVNESHSRHGLTYLIRVMLDK